MADRDGSGELEAPFRPLRRRAHWTVGLLAVGIAADAVAVWSGLLEQSLLADIAAGRPVSLEDVDASDRRQAIVGIVQTGIFTLTATAFLAWLYRAYRNVDALSLYRRRWKHGWAVGAWFVPILNLWRPKQIVNDAWRGSSPGGDAVPAWLAVWWGSWLAAQTLYNVSFRLSLRAEEIAELETAGRVTLAADVVSVPAALLAIALVLRVTRLQEARAATAGLVAQEADAPLYRRRSAWASVAAVVAALALQGALLGAVWSGALDVPDSGQAESGPLVDEDFARPGSGWLVDSGPGFTMGYANGKYRIAVMTAGQEMHSYIELLQSVDRLDLQVEATVREGSKLDGYGLGCWVGSSAGYYAAVFADGVFTIAKDPGAQAVETLEEGRNRSWIVDRGVGATELRFQCLREGEAARLALWVDGRRMASARDARPLSAFTGLGLFTSSASGRTDVRFDNFIARD